MSIYFCVEYLEINRFWTIEHRKTFPEPRGRKTLGERTLARQYRAKRVARAPGLGGFGLAGAMALRARPEGGLATRMPQPERRKWGYSP